MDPENPLDAQQVVIEYARVLQRDLDERRHPARADSLPYARPIVKQAVRTSVQQLVSSGQMTDDLREFLETAYVSLAEYLDGELVQLLIQYRTSADELAADSRLAREKTNTAAWRTLAQSSALAGEVARSIAFEAEVLRAEFQDLLAPV